MNELINLLLTFRWSMKLQHWKSKKYANHLLFDRLIEEVDDFIDDVAEKAFVATGNADKIELEFLDLKKDPKQQIDEILSLTHKLDEEENKTMFSPGFYSLLEKINEEFLTKRALISMKE